MKKSSDRTRFGRLMAGAAPFALALAAVSSPANAIVPNDNYTPDDIVDEDDVYAGVGQFFRNDGFVCTGTLINPRTVLFAAHCVNDRPESDYDTNGIIQSAFSFNVNALPGFIDWINNNFTSNPDLAVFNVNRIYYNQDSLTNPGAFGFLEADIALASLDTPAANLPTWSLLFSPLPTPEQITDADGTGYHVAITGYGRSGSGTGGATTGIDWRRKAAENMLGSLTSFDERNTFLFGAPFGNLPQSLYRLDFDDPNKTNPFDFNLYKDEPREREGTTAGGDSGGPLILDAANNTLSDEDLVIGVLSGGSRFFGPQAFSSYGTESFYQPLYLFWDYIVATNPYRYVTNKAGDGRWEDGSHWETTLDPIYRVIDADGNVVNGLPTTPGAGITGGSPDFGEVCFDPEGDNVGDGCQDLATGDDTPPARTALEGGVASGIGVVDGVELAGFDLNGVITRDGLLGDGLALAVEAHNGADLAEETPFASDGGAPEFSDDPLPAATIDNGLPGATGFVPNNVDPVVSGDPDVNVDPRYYDVTLQAAGNTTLGTDVTIDRLTVRGPAELTIYDQGSLTSLIDVSQFGGTVTVNGALNSTGDYTLFGGLLGGRGTVTTPFLTNIMGAISPGLMGQIGTFTVDGNLVLSSGSTLLIDISGNGASDTVAVTGEASVGGVVALGTGVTQVVNGNGVQYTILTADGGGIVDTDGNPINTFVEGTISAILSQSFTYEENAVLMEIEAGNYVDVVDATDPVQLAYAQLLDQERSNPLAGDLYALDFASTGTIQSTLNGLAPVGETAIRTLTAQSYTQLMNFNAGRMATSSRASTGGTVATLGNPLGTAEAGLARAYAPNALSEMGLSDHDDMDVEVGAVPDSMAVFFAGGFINGEGDSMPGFQNVQTDFDGYFLAGGVEFFPSDNSMIGASVYHSNLDADVALGGTADSELWAGSFYGRAKTGAGLVFEGQFSFSNYNTKTARTVDFLGTPQTLVSNDTNGGIAAGLGVSYDIDMGGLTVAPGIETRYTKVSFDRISEQGGFAALRIDREKFESFQGRAGLELSTSEDSAFQLRANADYVHEFEDGPQLFTANFVNGVGSGVPFAYDVTDEDWFEVGASASFGSGPIRLGVGVDTTIGRDNAEAQTYSASATIRF